MKKKEEPQGAEVDLSVIFKFFSSNGKIFLVFITISVIGSQINQFFSKAPTVIHGTSVIKISRMEVPVRIKANKTPGMKASKNLNEGFNVANPTKQAEKINEDSGNLDYTKLNLIKSSIPGYIELIFKKNVVTTEIAVNDDKKDSADQTNYNRDNFKVENFDGLAKLKDAKWVEQNITGSNGRFVVSKKNEVPLSRLKLFGKDFIYAPFEDIIITTTGNSKKVVNAALENAQTALGRSMQYTLARQWIADSINSLTLEKFQLKKALVSYSEKTKKIQSKINYHKNNIENNPEGKLPLFTDLPPNHPEYLLPLATRIYALRYNALEINLEVIDMQNRLKLIQIEKNLFTKYQSNFDEKFTKLTAPNIQELSNSVLQKLKNTSDQDGYIHEGLTRHLRDLNAIKMMPRVFSQQPFVSYISSQESVGRKFILSLMFGLFLALSFISIRFMTRDMFRDKK
mgnify:FL=1